MFTPASISLHSLQHQACLPSDLSSPAGASTWGGVYIPGILLSFGGPCRSHVGEGGGSREETQSWSPCDLCCSGWEGETPSHVSPRGGPVLQGLAGPCSHTQGFGGGGIHLSFLTCQMGATHCNRLIKPVGRLKRLEGPLACSRPQC